MEMLHAGLAPLNCESRRVIPPPPMLRVFNPPPLPANVSYSRYFIERSIEKDFQRVTLRFLCEGTIDDCQ